MTKSNLVMSIIICLCFAVTGHAGGLERYTCHRAPATICIDGKLDDAAWQRADVITFVVPVSGKKPLSKTEARISWDDSCLYVAYRAYDKDVWSIFKSRDSMTCQEDCLECFVQPDSLKQTYYNFEINALGTIYDAKNLSGNSGGYDHHRWAAWDCEGLRVGISVGGTLDNLNDKDRCWQMELAVPFAELPSLSGGRPKVGEVWRFLLARYDYSVYLPQGVELSSCAHLSAVNFHMPEQWSSLKFAE